MYNRCWVFIHCRKKNEVKYINREWQGEGSQGGPSRR